MWAISIIVRQFLTVFTFIPIFPINSFNIDQSYPIIIQTIENGQTPIPNQFGACVAFLKPDQSAYSWIVIGSPKVNSAQNEQQPINHFPEHKVIWQCSLGRDLADVCMYNVIMDPTGNFHNGGSHELENERKSGNDLVMSALGLERWMGNLILYVSGDGGVTFNESFVSQASKYSDSGVGCPNYLSYSFASGYFYENNANVVNDVTPVYFAAGNPSANNQTGEVVIFRFLNDPKGSLSFQQEITGYQSGAYFGSSLLFLDLNGDGFDDLMVGSPKFSRGQKEKAGPRGGRFSEPILDSGTEFNPLGIYGEEGAVFIYFSTNYGRAHLHRQEKILHGGNSPWCHFGTAFTSLGDLNHDGYKDFAVSAPYEDTSGSVYIYLGNKDGNILEHTQVIRGKQINSGLRGFGFSLASNEDIDNNGFNDISIGSFDSSQVVVLRAKPIITVHDVVKCSLDKLPLNVQTFQIESCVSFTGDYLPSSVQLKILLLADANFRPHRVQIRRDGEFGASTSNFIEYKQQVMKSSNETCAKFHAIVTEPLETSGDSVDFRQIISMAQETESIVRQRTMNIHPKSGYTFVTGAKFSDFCKTCPVINTLKPSTFALQLPLAVPCGDDHRPISKWIYILAVVIGFLGLCFFGFFIYSRGCFHKKQPHLDKNGETVVDGEETYPLSVK